MTIKTITLSRELVERIVKTCPFTLLELDYQELRAALAEPVPPVEFVQGHPPSCRAADEYKPGECGHGCEPVPPAGEAQQVHTDCRSEEGITVGLVDTVINCARLLKSRPTTAAVEYALQDLRADEDVAALVADPVPPAGGDVEVLAAMLRYRASNTNNGQFHWGNWSEWREASIAYAESKIDQTRDSKEAEFQVIELVDRAHVTRLQAEVFEFRTALQVANKNTKQVMAERAALQAELTKARELLKDIQNSTIDTLLHSRIDTVLSNQSAPADKAQVNPEHTLFNEIRISEPVNEDGEPTRYLITEAQLQRIRALETDKGQGEPVHECQKCWGRGVLPTRLSGEGETQYRNRCKSYAEQPSPVAVVMPDDIVRDAERYRILRDGGIPSTGIGDDYLGGVYVWDQRGEKYQECGKEISGDGLDACLDEAARLNNLK